MVLGTFMASLGTFMGSQVTFMGSRVAFMGSQVTFMGSRVTLWSWGLLWLHWGLYRFLGEVAAAAAAVAAAAAEHHHPSCWPHILSPLEQGTKKRLWLWVENRVKSVKRTNGPPPRAITIFWINIFLYTLYYFV